MTNSMRSLFEAIESPRSAARLNLASGSEHFLRLLSLDPNVRELLSNARTRSQAEEVLQRLLQLAQNCVDRRYENPFDAAMAAYLLVLQSTYPNLSRIAAEAVLATARNCWWGERLAKEVLKQETARQEPARVETQAGSPSVAQLVVTAFDADDPLTIADYASSLIRQFGRLTFIPLEDRNSARSGRALSGPEPQYLVAADNSDRPADSA